MSAPTRPNRPQPPSASPQMSSPGTIVPKRQALLATLGIACVMVLMALDQTVVGTALPSIVAELHGFRLYAWIATAYMLASVVTMPICGKLGDDFGRKPLLLASILLFVGASVLCGLSVNMPMLVGARALQGIGGGMLVATASASIPDLFPGAHDRLRWQSILSAAFGLGNAVGPTLGGVLTQSCGWRSIFFVNLPIGLICFRLVSNYLPTIRQRDANVPASIDWVGAALLTVALGTMQLAISAFSTSGFTGGALAWLAMMLIAGGFLWRWALRRPDPVLPLAMFANPKVSGLFILSIIAGFSMYSLLLYAPLLFQGGFGMTPANAGLAITPLVACVTLGSILNAQLVTRLRRPKVMLYVGFALIALCCVGFMLVHKDTSPAILASCMAMGGFGLGTVLPLLTIFGQEQAGKANLGTVMAMLQTLRMIGGMLGTAITGALVTHLYGSSVRKGLVEDAALSWYGKVANPQILIDKKDQHILMLELAQHGHNALGVIDMARIALSDAIHIGIGIAAVMAIVGMWRARSVIANQIVR